MPTTPARTVTLRAAGTCFVVELTEPVPRVLHWGADLGELTDADHAALSLTAEPAVLNNSLDHARRFTVWPTEADGWSGTPAHHGHLDGAAAAPRLTTTGSAHRQDPAGGGELTIELTDGPSGLDVTLTYRLEPSGVLGVSAALTRREHDADGAAYGPAPYDLAQVVTLLPLPRRATEILDFTGKWSRERSPQRRPLAHGTHSRESRRGKPGVDSPYLLTVGVPGFGFRDGEVWGVHVAWSGDQRYLVEQLFEGAGTHASALGGGELLRAGEIRLAPGQTYRTPVCHFAWSADGLDGLADALPRPAARQGHPPGHPPPARAQQLGGRLLRPRPGPAAAAGRQGGRSRRRTLRAGRRLVHRPPRRQRGARRLDRRPGGLAARTVPAGGPCALPRHGLRAVGRAGDGQPRLRPGPRAPRLGARPRGRPRRLGPQPARP